MTRPLLIHPSVKKTHTYKHTHTKQTQRIRSPTDRSAYTPFSSRWAFRLLAWLPATDLRQTQRAGGCGSGMRWLQQSLRGMADPRKSLPLLTGHVPLDLHILYSLPSHWSAITCPLITTDVSVTVKQGKPAYFLGEDKDSIR